MDVKVDAYVRFVEGLGLVAKPSKLVRPTTDPVSILGLDFSGVNFTYALSPEKMSALISDNARFISSYEATGLQLSSLLGRWTWAMMVRRSPEYIQPCPVGG